MTSINLLRDDITIDNIKRKSAASTSITATGASQAIPSTQNSQPQKYPDSIKRRTFKQRRKGERRKNNRRKQQHKVMLDTRSQADRRHNDRRETEATNNQQDRTFKRGIDTYG